jgi:hypothetical protein
MTAADKLDYVSQILLERAQKSAQARRTANAPQTLRSHTSVRSACFRELVARFNHPEFLELDDFRVLWRVAHYRAMEWRRQATNRFNPATAQWEQGR